MQDYLDSVQVDTNQSRVGYKGVASHINCNTGEGVMLSLHCDRGKGVASLIIVTLERGWCYHYIVIEVREWPHSSL